MNGYKAFYRGKTLDVYAETSLQARDGAAIKFKAKKNYEVTVVLCEKDTDGTKPGEQVIHNTSGL